jgi:hypothetical protein
MHFKKFGFTNEEGWKTCDILGEVATFWEKLRLFEKSCDVLGKVATFWEYLGRVDQDPLKLFFAFLGLTSLQQ